MQIFNISLQVNELNLWRWRYDHHRRNWSKIPRTCSFSVSQSQSHQDKMPLCLSIHTYVSVFASKCAYWFCHYYVFSKQNGKKVGYFYAASCVSGTVQLFVFLCVPRGVHWSVEKKGKAVAKSLALQQVPGLNSQQWPGLCRLHAGCCDWLWVSSQYIAPFGW